MHGNFAAILPRFLFRKMFATKPGYIAVAETDVNIFFSLAYGNT